MAGMVFLGYALVGLGPALALLLTSILHRPFLVLLALSSAFCWLVVLIALALLWRPLLFSALSPPAALGLLLSAVLAQELTRRHLILPASKWLEGALNSLADLRYMPRVSLLDKVSMAAATGFGHGAAHAVFFFLSITTPSLGAATLYLDVCPVAPFFLVVALLSAAFTVVHTTASVTTLALQQEPPKGPQGRSLGFSSDTSALLASSQSGEEEDEQQQQGGGNLASALVPLPLPWLKALGLGRGHGGDMLLVPALHFLAAASTLVNLLPFGCLVGAPLVWLCALGSCLLCYKALCIMKTRHQLHVDSQLA